MKKSNNDESIFQKKGFYLALYSCLGVALVSASVMSIINITKVDEDAIQNSLAIQKVEEETLNSENSFLEEYSKEQSKEVSSNTAESYLENELYQSFAYDSDFASNESYADNYSESYLESYSENADENSASGDTAKKDEVKEENPESIPENVQENTPENTQDGETNSNTTDDTAKKDEVKEENPESSPESIPENTQDGETNSNTTDDTAKNQETTINVVETSFSPFAEGDTMSWPLNGEIVMDFSVNALVYDQTLDQYRTNNNLCISSSVGSQVKASSDGKVVEVSKDSQYGNTVVIDHGNGWSTTYSQLQENILVKEGDVVAKGDIIGGVGEPTYYGVLLGEHLNFKVARNDEVVDPKTVLAN